MDGYAMENNSLTEETQTEDAAASSYENFLTKRAMKIKGTIKDTMRGATAQAGLQYKANGNSGRPSVQKSPTAIEAARTGCNK